MENFYGAMKCETTPEDYSAAGRRLTEAATKKLHGGCAVCEEKNDTLYLWHFSVESGDVISSTVCRKCAEKNSFLDLLANTVEKLLAIEEMKRSARCTN